MADERDARRKLQPTRRSDSGRAHWASSTPRASRVETTRETSDAVRARIEARRAARQGAQASQERPSQARHVTSPSRTRAERPQDVDGGRRRAEKAGPSPAERLGGLASGAGDTLARIRDNLKPNYLLLVLGVLALLLLVTLISRCARGAGSATPTTPVAPAEPQHVSVMMVGDILVHQGVWESGQQADGSYNYDHLFAHIADDLAEADIAMLDQETVLGGRDRGLSGYPIFNGPHEIADAEVAAGFDVILHASNHAMDQGDAGLSADLTYWHDNHPGMLVAGAVIPGQDTAAHRGATYWRQGDFVIAILNVTYDLNGFEDPSDAVFEIDEEEMRADIEAAEAKADLTIVCPHWGDEGTFGPNAEQRELAQMMCDWGVDLVIGNHPHVPQPVEVLTGADGHQMPVFWSTGNFVSTMLDKENLVAGIAKAELVKDENGARVVSVSFEPIVTHRGFGNEMTTYHLADYTDELAATNYWRSDDVPVYPSEAENIFADIMGSGYDRENDVLTITLETPATEGSDGSAETEAETEAGADQAA